MSEKRRLGTKAKIRVEKERERKIAMAIFSALILLTMVLSAYFGYAFFNSSQNQTVKESSQLKAAIVDQLSLTIPNQTFVENVKRILGDAGYAVDYYSGEKVTVEFYRNLATHGYKLIILRVHSGLGPTGKPPLALFTSELYSTRKYIYEQLYDEVSKVAFDPEIYGDNNAYFGVMPDFIRKMNGKFDDTTIIMMGCDGIPSYGSLIYVGAAKAFVEKGAKVYISWSGPVLGSHSDTATVHLLKNLIIEKQTIGKAVENTMMEVGSDPIYKSQLQFYPRETENEVLFVSESPS